MSIVSKEISGLIYETDFSTLDGMWEISDIDRIAIGDGLKISCGESIFTMSYKPLTEIKEFVIDIKNTYNPTKEGELGGIIIFGDTENIIRLEEYYDKDKGTSKTYEWIRMVRDHNIYTGYGSQDGLSWEMIGTANFGEVTPKIGIFLEGNDEDMIVDYMRIYRTSYITVVDAPTGDDIVLETNRGVLGKFKVPRHYPIVKFPINAGSLPIHGRFVWEGNEGFEETPFYRDMWGGDVYRFNIGLDLYYLMRGEWLRVEANEEEFLGYINQIGDGNDTINYVKMKLKNNQKYTYEDTIVRTVPVEGKEEQLDYVDIGFDKDSGEFSKELQIGDVVAGAEKEFYVRLERPARADSGMMRELYFKIQPIAYYERGG